MAKRYTDSRKWDDPWFRKLPMHYKLLWQFILDKCDHAGFYKPDLEMAGFCVGYDFKEKDVLKVFSGRISFTKKNKWFIQKFIEFQYGTLDKSNRCHKSVLEIIKKEGACMPLTRGKDECKSKDKDKDKDISGYTIKGKPGYVDTCLFQTCGGMRQAEQRLTVVPNHRSCGSHCRQGSIETTAGLSERMTPSVSAFG